MGRWEDEEGRRGEEEMRRRGDEVMKKVYMFISWVISQINLSTNQQINKIEKRIVIFRKITD